MKYKYVLFLIVILVVACQPINEDPMSLLNETELNNETINAQEQLAAYRLTVTEGELASIPVTAVDPDGGDVTITFGEPFNEDGLWLTELGDEGRYLVRLQASDGILTTTEYVLVEVLRANRPPVIECPTTIRVVETETVELNCNIVDPEGHDFEVAIMGWMNSETKETTYGDSGSHTVIVRAVDEKGAANSAEINVVVDRLNRPPQVEPIPNQEVLETETLVLEVSAQDPDGDMLEIIYSEPFDEFGRYTPDFGDRGTYNSSVIVSDGFDQVIETFEVTVLAKNRPPVLEPIEPITVYEGETITIPVNAYDPDGDDLIISYSGFMNSRTYTTTYDDAYPNGCNERGCTAVYYTVVTVSDGQLETSREVEINIIDRNRPPVFIFD